MKRFSVWFLTFSLLGLMLLQSEQAPQREPVVILHVTVIDPSGAEAASDQMVVINGDRITALGKAGEVSIPKGNCLFTAPTAASLVPAIWLSVPVAAS